MTTIFYARPYGWFIEIKINLSREKLYRINQDSNGPEDNFSNRDNIRSLIYFRRERQPQDTKILFFIIFKSIAPVLSG